MARRWHGMVGTRLLLSGLLSLAGTGSATAQTTSAWRWTADTAVRLRDGVATLDFAAAGITLTRGITRRTSVGAGYLYAAGFPDSGQLFEHRVVQHLTWRSGGRTAVSFKTRLEERLVTGRNTMLRVRQQARVLWPLISDGRLLAIVSEEVLVQSAARILAFGFDSNRFFAGIGRRLTPHTAVEAGYLNVYSRHGSTGRQHHVMSIAVATTW